MTIRIEILVGDDYTPAERRLLAFLNREASPLVSPAPTLAADVQAPVPAPAPEVATTQPGKSSGKKSSSPAVTAPTAPTAPVAEAAAPAKTDAECAQSAASAAAAPQVSTAAPETPKVERAAVSKAAVALAMKDKVKIKEILASFDGAAAVRDVPDDKLAAVFAAIQAATAALGA
jgi:pyruvate dehydrogenase E2 component (dihydrolipoamide acetyltransferase)